MANGRTRVHVHGRLMLPPSGMPELQAVLAVRRHSASAGSSSEPVDGHEGGGIVVDAVPDFDWLKTQEAKGVAVSATREAAERAREEEKALHRRKRAEDRAQAEQKEKAKNRNIAAGKGTRSAFVGLTVVDAANQLSTFIFFGEDPHESEAESPRGDSPSKEAIIKKLDEYAIQVVMLPGKCLPEGKIDILRQLMHLRTTSFMNHGYPPVVDEIYFDLLAELEKKPGNDQFLRECYSHYLHYINSDFCYFKESPACFNEELVNIAALALSVVYNYNLAASENFSTKLRDPITLRELVYNAKLLRLMKKGIEGDQDVENMAAIAKLAEEGKANGQRSYSKVAGGILGIVCGIALVFVGLALIAHAKALLLVTGGASATISFGLFEIGKIALYKGFGIASLGLGGLSIVIGGWVAYDGNRRKGMAGFGMSFYEELRKKNAESSSQSHSSVDDDSASRLKIPSL